MRKLSIVWENNDTLHVQDCNNYPAKSLGLTNVCSFPLPIGVILFYQREMIISGVRGVATVPPNC